MRKGISRIDWVRIHEGQWIANLKDWERHRRKSFTAINVSRRNWILYDMGDDIEYDWKAILQVKTWRECRAYVEGYFEEWMRYSDTSSMIDRRVRIAT